MMGNWQISICKLHMHVPFDPPIMLPGFDLTYPMAIYPYMCCYTLWPYLLQQEAAKEPKCFSAENGLNKNYSISRKGNKKTLSIFRYDGIVSRKLMLPLRTTEKERYNWKGSVWSLQRVTETPQRWRVKTREKRIPLKWAQHSESWFFRLAFANSWHEERGWEAW